MVFPNLYYKRTAATAKACYVCYKPTVTVLATIDTADFFYACPVHLTDRGFAARAPDPEPEPKKPSVSAEEIAKVKQEWEEKQREKKDKTQNKGQGQADGEEGKGEEATQKEAEGAKEVVGGSSQEKKPAEGSIAPSTESPPTPTPTPTPTHERYILHRNIYALRTADHRRRRQAAQTKDLAPRLPGTPSALP